MKTKQPRNQEDKLEVKCKQPRPGFEFRSPIQFLIAITVTLRAYTKNTNKVKLLICNPDWLVEFYGISTFVGYLMPNPFLYK